MSELKNGKWGTLWIWNWKAWKNGKLQTGEINWVTAIFMGTVSVGAVAALFFFTWKAFFVAIFLWWVVGQPGHWHGLSSAAHSSRLQNSEVGGIFPDMCATLALKAARFSG